MSSVWPHLIVSRWLRSWVGPDAVLLVTNTLTVVALIRVYDLDLRHGSSGRWASAEIGAGSSTNNGTDQTSHVASPEEPEEGAGCLSLTAAVLGSHGNFIGIDEGLRA